jgi:hypothetical protein
MVSSSLRSNQSLDLAEHVRGWFHASIHSITTWTNIDNSIAKDFKVRAEFIAEQKKTIFEDGHIMYRYGGKKKDQDPKRVTPKLMIPATQLLVITMHVDSQHSEGKALTNKKPPNWLSLEKAS